MEEGVRTTCGSGELWRKPSDAGKSGGVVLPAAEGCWRNDQWSLGWGWGGAVAGGKFGLASHAQPSSKMAMGENRGEGNSRVMGLGSKSQLFE